MAKPCAAKPICPHISHRLLQTQLAMFNDTEGVDRRRVTSHRDFARHVYIQVFTVIE